MQGFDITRFCVGAERDGKNVVKGRGLRLIRVSRAAGSLTRGHLIAGNHVFPAALGRGGIRAGKREGDGSTPRGRFRLLRLWYRADRLPRPRSFLPLRRIRKHDGWCEDPRDRNYNRPVKLSSSSGADRLWRDDHLYDLIIELDHNTRPRIPYLGSAVFIHFARREFSPTAGCVALKRGDLQKLLPMLARDCWIEIL
jgi:L,D-peptidoglycan transpeptidase YkuD (ErfK/YbiS/YcfS/YnhG family)